MIFSFSVLYSGPLSEAKVIFPVGEFKLYAEIHEEAGAYSPFIINPKFSTVLPFDSNPFLILNLIFHKLYLQ